MKPEKIESLAALVSNGDTQHVSELADAVLSFPRLIEIPETVKVLLRARVENAELGYWQGTRTGVKEADLVVALDDLSESLKLPPEAKTTLSQVHEIRIKLSRLCPCLMGLKIGSRDTSGTFHLSDSLSALQAIHLLSTIIDLKFILPEYQVTPLAWEAPRQDKLLARKSSIVTDVVARPSVRTNNTPETHKLYQGLFEGLSRISDSEGLDLISRTLKHLGVD